MRPTPHLATINMAAVNWLCLLLAYEIIHLSYCIRVDINNTESITATSTSTIQPHFEKDDDNVTLLAEAEDSAISASERSRRLIPYMAFYLPASELPLSKQYALHMSNEHRIQHEKGSESGNVVAMSRVPLPESYMHMKMTSFQVPLRIPEEQRPHYAPSSTLTDTYQQHPDTDYRSVAYHSSELNAGQSFAAAPIKQVDIGDSKFPRIVHLLAVDTHAEPSALTKSNNGNLNVFTSSHKRPQPHRFKTVQYFPPLSSQSAAAAAVKSVPSTSLSSSSSSSSKSLATAIRSLHHNNVGAYRPRSKQSKNNLTPFTATNSVPGHFVPIVYTPINPNTNSQSNINNNNNNDNHVVAHAANAAQETTHIVLYDDEGGDEVLKRQPQYKQQQQQQQHTHNAVQYSASLPAIDVQSSHNQNYHQRYHNNKHPQQQHQHQQQQQPQYFSVTSSPRLSIPVTISSSNSAVGKTPTISLNNLHRPPSVALHDETQQITFLNESQQKQLHANHHFQPPRLENFFEKEIDQKQEYLRSQTIQGRDHNVENDKTSLLPLMEYDVAYLQPRFKYRIPQQQQSQQEPAQHQQSQHHLRLINEQKYRLNSKEPVHVFVLSSTLPPRPVVGSVSATVTPKPIQHAPSINSQYNHPRPPTAYHQHEEISPIHHIHLKPSAKQVLAIPVRSLYNGFNGPSPSPPPPSSSYNHKRPQTGAHILPSLAAPTPFKISAKLLPSLSSTTPLHSPQYPKIIGSTSTPHYVNYLLNEPKQSLKEEHNVHMKSPTIPPQTSYIVVTTARPYPLYKTQSKLQLQVRRPLENNIEYSTQRYPPARSSSTSPPLPISLKSSPKFIYVKEEFGKKLIPLRVASKLKRPLNIHQNNDNAFINTSEQDLQSVTPQLEGQNKAPAPSLADPNDLPDIRTSSLAEILHKLQDSNHLPHTLTPENIDNSIKTLIRILNNLKQTQTIGEDPPQHHDASTHANDIDYDKENCADHAVTPQLHHHHQQEPQQKEEHRYHQQQQTTPSQTDATKNRGPNTGRPGIDYPNYADIPETSFACSQQRYKGFFGDPETNCQVWHYCDLNGGKASFLCPNGTIFSQIALTCDWWFNVKCATTAQLYVLNERLYKYILPFTPKFPEDYSGPLVDKYLAMKFQEMEEKMRLEREKDISPTKTTNEDDATTTDNIIEDDYTTQESLLEVDINENRSQKHVISEQSSERNLLIDDEMDDNVQRDSEVNKFEGTTTIGTMVTTTTIKSDKELPLSIKPIVVVSSTMEPDYLDDLNDNSANKQRNTQITEHNDKRTDTENGETKSSDKDSIKVTVEKVEIVEIKSDGSTGHLIPDMFKNVK